MNDKYLNKKKSAYSFIQKLPKLDTQIFSTINYNDQSIVQKFKRKDLVRKKQFQENILDSYSYDLKTQVDQYQRKRSKKQLLKKQQLLQKLKKQKRRSRQVLQQMENVKQRVKTLNLQKYSQIYKNQRLLILKNIQSKSNAASSSYIPPYLNPSPPLLPYNPYQFHHYNPYNPYNNIQNQSQDFSRYGDHQISKSYIKANKNIFFNKKSTKYDMDQASYSSFKKGQKSSQKFKISKYNQKSFKNHKNLQKTPPKNQTNSINHRDIFKQIINKAQLKKKLKKAFIAAYFLQCLKKLYKNMIKQRKRFFLQFWPKQFIKTLQSYQQYFYDKFAPFFKVLYGFYSTLLLPTSEDTKNVKIQKNRTIIKIITLFFQNLKCLKNIQNIGKIAWAFCKHGSFVSNGVLTVNQLDFVCFNQDEQYLRMDKNLQKSQIISFIFIKSILYKFALHPQKKWPKQFNKSAQNKILRQNIKLVGSIIYALLIWLQDEYLDKVNEKVYKLGNLKDLKFGSGKDKFECAPSLMYDTKQTQNQIISGLYPQEVLKKLVSFKKIMHLIDIGRQIVQNIHTMSCKYHKKFRDQINLKKDKVNYAY